MAWTETQLDAIIVGLETALATGTLSVAFPDKSVVTYDSGPHLVERIAYFKSLRSSTVADAAGTTVRPKRLILCPTSGVC